jgi:hypothetical protein
MLCIPYIILPTSEPSFLLAAQQSRKLEATTHLRNIAAHALHTVHHIAHVLSLQRLAAAEQSGLRSNRRTSDITAHALHAVQHIAPPPEWRSLRLQTIWELRNGCYLRDIAAPALHTVQHIAYAWPPGLFVFSSSAGAHKVRSTTKSSCKSFFPLPPRQRSFSPYRAMLRLSLKALSQIEQQQSAASAELERAYSCCVCPAEFRISPTSCPEDGPQSHEELQ